MHAISSYRGNRPTNKQTHTQTDRGDYNTLRRSLARSVTNQPFNLFVYKTLYCMLVEFGNGNFSTS